MRKLSVSLLLFSLLVFTGCGENVTPGQIRDFAQKAKSVTDDVLKKSPGDSLQKVEQPPQLEKPGQPSVIQPVSISDEGTAISICSFNIQFLGNSRERDNSALTAIVAPYDIVVVQELVSPPFSGFFPNGTPYKPDEQSADFFHRMHAHGFQYILSEEDTGTGDDIHRNGSSTEWWVAFYKPNKVQPAVDLPNGFLASDRSNHPNFERVPYAFGFRSTDGSIDFVLISVHLMPGAGIPSKIRRNEELHTIAKWIDLHDDFEKDFIILGDMNIENQHELERSTPPGFVSLNEECRPTNTNVRSPKPYDHVMYNREFTTEVDREFDMQIVDLVSEMKPFWKVEQPYPGQPYDHNAFRQFFSDHNPVVFRLNRPFGDDDGTVVTVGNPSERN